MTPLIPLPEAKKFGPYELTHQFTHSGNLGDSYLATQRGVEGFEKILFIKQIYEGYSLDERFAELFIERASEAVKLHHANIAQVLDLGRADSRYFLTTEFVSGMNLQTVIEVSRRLGKNVPHGLVVLVAIEALKALDYAHRRKDSQLRPLDFCHGGLAPSDLMLSWDGEVKVTDFAIKSALQLVPKESLRRPSSLLRYSAPEVVSGSEHSPFSDVFSLGAVLYEAVTGVHPFGADPSHRVAPASLREVSSADERLAAIIHQMLAVEPKERCINSAALFEPFMRLNADHRMRSNARTLSEWLTKLRKEADSLPPMPAEPPPPTLDIPSLANHPSDVGMIQDGTNASGIWSVSAFQQREFLQLLARVAPAGIEQPISRLREAFVACQRDGGRAIMIVGEPGAGKSFILRYALSLFAEAGAPSHMAVLSEVSQSVPFAIPAAWLASAAGIVPVDNKEVAANKIRVLATSLDLSNQEVESVLRVCGVDEQSYVGPGAMQDGAYAVLDKLMVKLSELGPVLLTVDNLQFTERASYNFLHRLLERLPKRKALLLMASDDPNYGHYFNHPNVEVLQVSEPEAREPIVQSLVHGLGISPMICQMLAYAPESLARVIDTIAITRVMVRAGSPPEQAAHLLATLDPSSRVATALQSLSPPEIQVLQWLAAAIEPLHVLLLKELMALPAAMLHGVLQNLLHLNLIVYAAPGKLALLTAEFGRTLLGLYDSGVVYGLHEYLARTLARTSNGTPQPWMQDQFARAGNAVAVVDHSIPYGRKLAQAGFPETALRHSERSLRDLHATQRELPGQRDRLQLDAARRSLEVMQWERAQENIEKVHRSAGIQSDPELWIEALATNAELQLAFGAYNVALEQLEEAQNVADATSLESTLSGQRTRIYLDEVRARWCSQYGELIVAAELLSYSRAAAEQVAPELVGRLATLAARVAARRGLVEEADEAAGAATLYSMDYPSHELRIRCALAEGEVALLKGDVGACWDAFEMAYEMAHESGHVLLFLEAAELLIDSQVRNGRSMQARGLMNYVFETAQRYGAHAHEARVRLAQCYLDAAYRGEPASMQALQLAFETALQSGIPSEIVRISTFLAEALDRQVGGEEAGRVQERGDLERRQRGYSLS